MIGICQYLEAREYTAAIPAQVAIMVKRLIGDLGSNLPNIQSRMSDTLRDLLMTVPKVSLEYMMSLREVAKSLTEFTQLSKTTILPKLKQLLDPSSITWEADYDTTLWDPSSITWEVT